MKIKAVFTDERIKRVVTKSSKPTLDVELHLDPDETRDVAIPFTDKRKTVYLESALDLTDADANTTYAYLRVASANVRTLKLTPNEGQVVPADADVDEVRVISNSPQVGTVRLVVV